jgi:L-ascorbate metabolism protein UlaG (beta-lactamase superfamily)
MGPKEAAIAAKMIGAQINIPIHYGTFPALTGRAEDFELECRKLGVEGEVRVLNVGDGVAFGE